MKSKLNKLVAALTMVFLATTSTVRADVLDGQTVRTTVTWIYHNFPPTIYSFDRVVGPETELMNQHIPPTDNYIDIDFSDTNILIKFVSGRGFQDPPGFTLLGFEDALGTIPRFTSVTFNPVETTWPGYNYSPRVDPNSFSIGLRGGSPGAQISVDISTMIPEPATGGLMLVSVAFLVTGRRRLAHAACTNLPTSFTVSSY
jgi:hypothetical protein